MAGYSQSTFTVYFDFNSYLFTPETKARLDSFLLSKKGKPDSYSIRINGYCDPIGSDSYNDELSMYRAANVKDYLLKNGVELSNIKTITGHGEKDPLNENKTEQERRLNRRVEISLAPVDQTVLTSSKENFSLTEKLTDTATKAGTSIVLKNMNFYGGTPFLLPESFPIVDELLEVMRRHPTLVIEIQGHICCVGYPDDSPYVPTGTGLSEERAKAIYAELIGKGIARERVSYKGFGHSMPIYPYPEKTEDERVANRRVEIKIISK